MPLERGASSRWPAAACHAAESPARSPMGAHSGRAGSVIRDKCTAHRRLRQGNAMR
ncbi:hypothetical protein MicB006_0368 [Micromonospora sp. B006]|nr:hypothetical protein MicB006_0368 [Micromonospora sp. B006]